MKHANLGIKIEAAVEFEIEKLERDNGIVCASGYVEVEGRKRWVTIPLSFCEEAVELGNGGEVVENVDPEDRRGL